MATLQELRESVGNNVGGLLPFKGTVRTVDSDLRVTVSDYALGLATGHRAYYRGQVADITGQDGGLVTQPALTSLVLNDTVEIWDSNWAPDVINEFINQAIRDTVGAFYVNADPITKCVTTKNHQFTLPSDLSMVQTVFRRTAASVIPVFISQQWEQANDGSRKSEQDIYDYQYSPAQRITQPNTDNNSLYEICISPTNLTGMTHLEGWFRAQPELANSNRLTLRLLEGTTTVGEYNVQADGRDWTFLQIPLGVDRYRLDKVDKVQLAFTRLGSNTHVIHTNGLWALDNDSVVWEPMDRQSWRVDPERRTVSIEGVGSLYVGYRGNFFHSSVRHRSYRRSVSHSYLWPVGDVIEIQGGKDPVLLNADSDETEADDTFVIRRATELAFGSKSGGRERDPQNYAGQGTLWATRAQIARANFPALVNIRRLTA